MLTLNQLHEIVEESMSITNTPHIDATSLEGTFTIAQPIQPEYFLIYGVAKIWFDGRIEFEPGYTPDKAAEQFWNAINQFSPISYRPAEVVLDDNLSDAAEISYNRAMEIVK